MYMILENKHRIWPYILNLLGLILYQMMHQCHILGYPGGYEYGGFDTISVQIKTYIKT